MKGAPERVLSFCTRILRNGQAEVLTEESRRNFQEAYERLGGYGERVLGLAYADMEGFANDYPVNSSHAFFSLYFSTIPCCLCSIALTFMQISVFK